jgi:phosphoribosyl 1,2-cyclic phosphodiesterase
MRIKIWGCRGSLPTPGPRTVRYGGNTTCVELRLDDGTVIVLDAGSGLRNLGRALRQRDEVREVYLYLTHTHWDHLMGFPFFEPGYSPDFVVRIRGGSSAKGVLKGSLENQMRAPHFPIPFEALRARFDFHVGDPRSRAIGSCEVEPIALNHPGGGYGFKFTERGKSFVFLPDNELSFGHVEGMDRERYVEFCRGAELLLHDAQYTDQEYLERRGWGHTTVTDSVWMALDAGVKRLGLFHHDPDHPDDEVDGLLAGAQRQAARDGGLECFAAAEGMEIVI